MIKRWMEVTPDWWESDWHEDRAAKLFAKLMASGSVITLIAAPESVVVHFGAKDRAAMSKVFDSVNGS